MQHNRNVIDWDPDKGCARQGDVILFRLPESFKPNVIEQVRPINNKLVLQEGELTGHNHAIWAPVMFNDTAMTAEIPADMKSRLGKFFAKDEAKVGNATLCLDTELTSKLQNAGLITRTDLCRGYLVVEGGPVILRHEEHDGIRIPKGNYYVGRQIESVGAEERVVRD